MRRLWLALALLGCSRETPPPEGQLVVHVTTDAPVSLFDRLALDVFAPGATEPCNECSREVTVDDTLFAERRASFGVLTPEGRAGYLLRVRLFRSLGNGPRPGSTLEKTVNLPAVEAESVTDVGVTLHVEDVAVPIGPVAPDPIQSLESWSGAASVPCPGAPGAHEVCVPGGAYWMGDPTIDTGDTGEYDGRLERLVQLAPFFVDRHEVTVAEFRASGLAHSVVSGGPSDDPHEANTGIASCTFTSEPASMEDHPVNCISWSLANEYCALHAGRLPTEAELEYLMSAHGRFAFPWGNQAPDCEAAVYGRETDGDECASLGIGTRPVGSGTLDRSTYPGGELLDLAGNVREWADDLLATRKRAVLGNGLVPESALLGSQPSGWWRARGARWRIRVPVALVAKCAPHAHCQRKLRRFGGDWFPLCALRGNAMSCLSDAVLLGFVEQRLDPAQRKQVEAHVDTCPACRRLLAMLAPREPSLLGERYELGRLIGRGSMGSVLEARDTRTGETVAIKRVQHPNPEILARFRREARLLEMFRHPSVVAIREVIDEPTGVAIVMERLEGETLDQRLTGGALTPAEARPIVASLFQIVAEAHDRGIVHRDLKPSNVYFQGERLLLLDFGLGTLSHTSSVASTLTRLTRTGAVLGTFAYMPPERMDGTDSGAPGDVWSAGAIGWRMLVGASPNELEPPLPSISTRATEVPDDLARWLDACLVADPSQRPTARACPSL